MVRSPSSGHVERGLLRCRCFAVFLELRGRTRDGLSGAGARSCCRYPSMARCRGRHFSLLVQRKVTKRNTPRPRAPAAARLGFVSPVGILGRHILCRPKTPHILVRRPADLPTGATAADGGPRAGAEPSQSASFRRCCCFAFAFRAPFKAWQAGRVKPEGRRTRMCAVFGRGRMPLPKIPGPIANPARAARRARRQGCVSFGYFSLHKQRKVTPRGKRTISGNREQLTRQRPKKQGDDLCSCS